MAAYVCPQLAAPVVTDMMEDMPCAEMDQEKPVHCAKHQTGDEVALEHLAAAPTLTPPIIAFAIPVIKPVVPDFLSSVWLDVPVATGTSPPYLHTQRLRI